MDFAASQQPPSKKRRFFKTVVSEDEIDNVTVSRATDESERVVLANGSEHQASAASQQASDPAVESSSMAFDKAALESLIGHQLDSDTLAALQNSCGNSLERAVNMYFDGTYKKLVESCSKSLGKRNKPPSPSQTNCGSNSQQPAAVRLDAPPSRYIGAFGIEGWATRSGTNIIKHGDAVRIERQKIQPPRRPKVKAKLGVNPSTQARAAPMASRRIDVIVRFTSESGIEIGRLAKDSANWVSTLMDQRICEFEGTCVYAPERLRTNDTVFLQLRCFLLNTAFDGPNVSLADERPTGLYELGETADERELRLRQVALVRLFQEINLQPTVSNATAKDGRNGLLKVAERDEQKHKDARKPPTHGEGSDSSEEGEDLEQDQLDALYKKAQCFDLATPEAEPADTFALTLRPYQKQSLYWMMAKEKNESGNRERSMHPLWEEYAWPVKDVDDKLLPQVQGQSSFYVNPYSGDLSINFPVQEQHCLGGILADEMGLGKTIQMLSLIHTHRSETALQSRISAGGGISSVNQLPRLAANSADILPAPCTTLVVAPMSLLAQWQSEAERASRQGSLKIELYYGNDKSNNLQTLCCGANAGSAPDLVITSYGVVLSEFSGVAAKNGDRTFHNGLFSLRFFRVILDEAHHIKNRASKTARACYAIAAQHRWVLTGTPIVNRLEDLFSLVRFLGVAPWDNFSFWKTFITVPFEAGHMVRALDVVQTVLEPLVMRRTKDMKTADGQPLVRLPPKEMEIVKVELSAPERDIYDHIFERAKRTLSRNVETGTVMKAFTTIFAQILRLRQSCCHPVLVRNQDVVADEEEAGAAADAAAGLADDMDLECLIAKFTAATDEAVEEKHVFGAHALEEIRSEADKECPLCLEEPMQDQVVTGCWHSACRKCIVDLMKHQSDRGAVPRCFNCREPLSQRDLFEVVRHDDDDDDDDGPGDDGPGPRISLQRLGLNHSSAKVAELISQLRALRRSHPTMKSVIFSQFTSFLSLIEPALDRAKVKFLRLDGSMAQRARAAVLDDFARRQGFGVLLISLRAGGVGLNLTSAGRVFMMDPWWSFAVEAQAIDRVHRLGQENAVLVKRFVVSGSVEERMLTVQERKKSIATSLGLMSDEEKKMQRIEDIKELLS
ncbi:hypothetical protein XA68_14272 [Ophiocordyceps unilateralis]|uniref:DNA repair protein RAD5 n=1 Tax=Ophiocordyceps unilateralis TaxID=268505 RepID=A0A2A9PN06_OPHUN|nr:hypothetical protein XA68_14272 [Ophiocordyceps unilateralis]